MRVVIIGEGKIPKYARLASKAIMLSGFDVEEVILLPEGATSIRVQSINYSYGRRIKYTIKRVWGFINKSISELIDLRTVALSDELIVIWDGKNERAKELLRIAKANYTKTFSWVPYVNTRN